MLVMNSSHLVTLRDQAATNPKLSPQLWHHLNQAGLSPDGTSPADFFYEDFHNMSAFSPSATVTSAPGATDTNASYTVAPNGYGVYADAGGTMNQIAEKGGVFRITTDGDDNDESWITSGGNTGTIAAITSAGKKVVFEAKFRVSQVADNGGAFFVGLAEEGCAAANTKADNTGVMADKDFIGFHTIHSDGDALVFTYKKAGQTQQNVFTYGSALEADTWYNAGFVYDPDAVASEALKVFIQNVEQGTYVTATSIAASTFPSGEELAFLAGIKNGGGAASTLDLDLWALYAEN